MPIVLVKLITALKKLFQQLKFLIKNTFSIMIDVDHIINLYAEINKLEQRMKQVTIANNYAVTRECEILLGVKYNELMNLIEKHGILKIDDKGYIHLYNLS